MKKEDIIVGLVYGGFVLIGIWACCNYLYIDERWIGAIGSIIGGSLTLLGVWITINYQKIESNESKNQFAQKMQFEKDRLENEIKQMNTYIEAQNKAFITIETTEAAIDFFGQLQDDEKVKIICDYNYNVLRQYVYNIINIELSNDGLKGEEPDALDTVVNTLRQTKACYFEINNLGPGYAQNLYWILYSSKESVFRCGEIVYLSAKDKIYLPITFYDKKKNMAKLDIVYKDSSGRYRQITWNEGIFSPEQEITGEEYIYFAKNVADKKELCTMDNSFLKLPDELDCTINKETLKCIFDNIYLIMQNTNCSINNEILLKYMRNREYIKAYETINCASQQYISNKIVKKISRKASE